MCWKDMVVTGRQWPMCQVKRRLRSYKISCSKEEGLEGSIKAITNQPKQHSSRNISRKGEDIYRIIRDNDLVLLYDLYKILQTSIYHSYSLIECFNFVFNQLNQLSLLSPYIVFIDIKYDQSIPCQQQMAISIKCSIVEPHSSRCHMLCSIQLQYYSTL